MRRLSEFIQMPIDQKKRYPWNSLSKKAQLTLRILSNTTKSWSEISSYGFSYQELEGIEIRDSHLKGDESDFARELIQDREDSLEGLVFELNQIFQSKPPEELELSSTGTNNLSLYDVLPISARMSPRIATNNFTHPTTRILIRCLIRSGKTQYLQEDASIDVNDLKDITIEEVAELKYVGAASLDKFVNELSSLDLAEGTALTVLDLIRENNDGPLVIFESQLSQHSINILSRAYGAIYNESAFDDDGLLKQIVLQKLTVENIKSQQNVGTTKANNLLRELRAAHLDNTDPSFGLTLLQVLSPNDSESELKSSVEFRTLSSDSQKLIEHLLRGQKIEELQKSMLSELTVASALEKCLKEELDFMKIMSELSHAFSYDADLDSLRSEHSDIFFDELNILLLTGNASSMRALKKAGIRTVGELFDTTRDSYFPKPLKKSLSKLRRAVIDCLYIYNGLSLTTVVEVILDDRATWRIRFQEMFSYPFENVKDISETAYRDLVMLEMRLSGKTLDEIGAQFGVTRERVRQILERLGSKLSPNFKYGNRDLLEVIEDSNRQMRFMELQYRADELSKLRDGIIEIVKKSPGISYSEISELMNQDIDAIESATGRDVSRFIEPVERHFEFDRWSDDDLIAILIEASDFASPLSSTEYKDLVDGGFIDGPGPQTIAKRFGTWNQACRLAGVEYLDSVRGEYVTKWSPESMLDSIIQFLQNTNSSGSLGAYDDWRKSQPGDSLPSGAHLRNEFSSWNTARSKALERMRSLGITPNL
jgi:hypothetical protein